MFSSWFCSGELQYADFGRIAQRGMLLTLWGFIKVGKSRVVKLLA